MSDTSLVFNLVGRDKGVSSMLARTSGQVRAANIASAASTVAFGVAMASASAHALAMGAALASTAGAAALLPAALAAGVGIIGAVKAVTHGLGDVWTATGTAATGGAAAAGAAAKRVSLAQREARDSAMALALAQRDLRDAQLAVAAAHATATERLDDQARALAGAYLDEEGAALAVSRAEQRLGEVRRDRKSGILDEQEAELALRQSEQTLSDVRDRVGDLAQEKATADRKGVEGSDEVQSALRRQEEAQRAVTQATERLADAQTALRESSAGAGGAVDAAAAALAKLSPAGRSLILTLRSLAPAWSGAFRGGQQAALSGVSGDIRRLSSTYLPTATTWLGRMGGAFNVAVRQSLGLAQSKKFVADVNTSAGNTAMTVDRLARALRPVVNGIMQFVAVGSAFLPGIAGSTLSLAQRFERWAVAARESGKIKTWIGGALGVLRQLGAIAGNVGASVAAIFRASDANAGKGLLDTLVRGSAAMRKWLESAQGQEKVRTILAKLRDVLTGVAAILPAVAGHSKEFGDAMSITGPVLAFAADHMGTLVKYLPLIAAGFVISKVAQTGANIAAVAGIPIRIAQMISQGRLTLALRAHTTALRANTVATRGASASQAGDTAAQNAGVLARGRAAASMVGQKIVLAATTVATWAATAAQWAYNAAQAIGFGWIILIIVAIAAVIAVIVLIATKTTWFQTAWKWAWTGIKAIASGVGRWFVDTLWKKWIVGAWNGITGAGARAWNWLKALPGKLGAAFVKVNGYILSPFRAAFNAIARLWNSTMGRLTFTLPNWVPGLGGKGFSMPQIPMLAAGGIVRATRGGTLAVLGEGGQDEAVVPLPRGGGSFAGGAGGGTQTVRLELAGDREVVAFVRRLIRTHDLLQGA